jgi:ribosomal protein L29
MTRHPPPHPSKDELRKMSLEQLDAYISRLRRELEWRNAFAHKFTTKQLEVAVKVRDLQYPDATDRRKDSPAPRKPRRRG